MKSSSRISQQLFSAAPRTSASSTRAPPRPRWICTQCLRKPTLPKLPRPQRRFQSTSPADDPNFESIVDKPARLVRSGRKHNIFGLIFLAAMPLTAFGLGCWQIQRLQWKTDLITKFEDRLIKPPLPLPARIDPASIAEFDYRRVYATGSFRHDQEMLIGPRLHDGDNGYLVVTPFEMVDPSGHSGTVLVSRGWISKDLAPQEIRRQKGGEDALPSGPVTVMGLLREPWKKNRFTPGNKPDDGAWYFPDVLEMAEHTGSQPVWMEQVMRPNLLESYKRRETGVPLGRVAEVNLRNNHTQYIFTWFSLSLATSIMLWIIIRKPPSNTARRVKRSSEWS